MSLVNIPFTASDAKTGQQAYTQLESEKRIEQLDSLLVQYFGPNWRWVIFLIIAIVILLSVLIITTGSETATWLLTGYGEFT